MLIRIVDSTSTSAGIRIDGPAAKSFDTSVGLFIFFLRLAGSAGSRLRPG